MQTSDWLKDTESTETSMKSIKGQWIYISVYVLVYARVWVVRSEKCLCAYMHVCVCVSVSIRARVFGNALPVYVGVCLLGDWSVYCTFTSGIF